MANIQDAIENGSRLMGTKVEISDGIWLMLPDTCIGLPKMVRGGICSPNLSLRFGQSLLALTSTDQKRGKHTNTE